MKAFRKIVNFRNSTFRVQQYKILSIGSLIVRLETNATIIATHAIVKFHCNSELFVVKIFAIFLHDKFPCFFFFFSIVHGRRDMLL